MLVSPHKYNITYIQNVFVSRFIMPIYIYIYIIGTALTARSSGTLAFIDSIRSQ